MRRVARLGLLLLAASAAGCVYPAVRMGEADSGASGGSVTADGDLAGADGGLTGADSRSGAEAVDVIADGRDTGDGAVDKSGDAVFSAPDSGADVGDGGGDTGTGGTSGNGDAGVPDAPDGQPDVPIGGRDGGVTGVDGSGGSGGSGDAGVPDAPDGQPDVPVGGTGGGGGTGGNPGTGGTTSSGGTTSAGGTGTGGAATGGTSTGGGTTNAGGTTTTGGTTSAGGTTTAGGITTAGGTTASGGTTSAGGTTTSGGTIASGGTTSAGGTTTAGGTIASGGSSGSGGTNGKGGTWGGTAPSCSGLTATCGPSNESCCKSLLVPGGTFDRSYDGVSYLDPNYPATVDDFYLDKYEITVGRFRVFVNAGMGTQTNHPTAGAGAHPGITGSGWDSTWNTNLAADPNSLEAALKCDATYQTWTDAAVSNESKPINCLDWYTAFAFCAWDGGRLATEAEWNYAASGGSEQRYYPWSVPATSTTIDDSYAVYASTAAQNVGSKSTTGDGKWGQSDLAGNLWEWTLDWYASPYSISPCNNCADLTTASSRVVRGGYFVNIASGLRSAFRFGSNPGLPNYGVGARCARTSL